MENGNCIQVAPLATIEEKVDTLVSASHQHDKRINLLEITGERKATVLETVTAQVSLIPALKEKIDKIMGALVLLQFLMITSSALSAGIAIYLFKLFFDHITK